MMNNNITPYLSLTIFVGFLFSSSAIADEREKREIVNQARQATVYIETNVGQGSGFFVTRDVIVTNFHVIEHVRNRPWLIKFRRENQQNLSPVKSVRGYDAQRDLALLKVSPSRVSPLVLGDSDSAEPLDTVYVTGYPKQYPKVTISTGNISAIHDNYRYERLQFTAPISGGSSGGPLLNDQGEVIGIVTSTRKSEIQFNSEGIEVDVPQNLNMAIPSKHLKPLLRTHGVRLPPKPKRKVGDRETKRKNEEKAKADAAIAKAEAERAKAEAKKAEAKAEAEKAKANAEKAKAEAERARAEAKKAEAERAKAEAESARTEKATGPKPITDKIDRLQSATVHIYGRDRNGYHGRLGSGFFVREDQVATDFHVVDGSTLKGVKPISRGTQSADALLPASLLKTKKAHYLAILHVETTSAQLLPIGNSARIQKDEEIRAFTNPSAPNEGFSKGKISASRIINGVQFFEFEAPVKPGSSGGPIVNRKGEVIAVAALNVPELSGTLKYAIPSNYLAELLEGEGDPLTQPTKPPTSSPGAEDDSETTPITPYLPKRLLEQAIELYERSRFNDAIEYLESALNGLHNPEMRAKAHLYLAFSKWGLAETESSVYADFREAFRYNPDTELPHRIGRDHPVFKPLLEASRQESIGRLSVSTSPPETEIWVFGGEMKRRNLGSGNASIRLFKGNYAVEGVLEGARKVMPVLIRPSEHEEISLVMPIDAPPTHEFELTLDLVSAGKPEEVAIHFTVYDFSNELLNTGKKEMQLREHKSEISTWVFHVNLPSAPQGGKIVYRIEADGIVIRDDPPQIDILEPPLSAVIDMDQPIPISARVISNEKIREVRVHFDAPLSLSDGSPSRALAWESTSNSYNGQIPVKRSVTDGASWFYVSATNENGIKTRSSTRAVYAKSHLSLPPQIAVLKPHGPGPLPINVPINFEAEVKCDSPIKEVRLYYHSVRKQLSDTSPSKTLENKSSDTYIGKIPKEHNQNEGYIWYFVAATAETGMESKTDDRIVEVKKPATQTRQGVWASHSWSNLVSDEGFYSGWERGDVLSLAFLREGKGVHTLGAQVDYTYENPDYISATVQWGPSARDASVVFAFLAGAAGYRSSDPEFSRVRQSRQITPLLGGSMRFFPLDRVALDLTGTMKLRSDDSTPADREPSFADDFLHHYEMGIRLYISPSLNLKAGYGRWRFGGYDNASVQVGLGATF